MNIKLRLSEVGIDNAIRVLERARDNLEIGVQNTVEVLAKDGSMIAQAYYGSMATANDRVVNSTTAVIETTGEANIIAEFGAGDDTEPNVGFENMPNTPVYAGSYSELVGSGEYASKGYWHFGGKVYTGVTARHGLLNAKEFIVREGVNIAKGVIQL